MRRTTISLWTFAYLFLATALAGQGLPVAAPAEDVGLSAERLARIRAVFAEDIERGELAGAVALVARRGKVAYFEPLGERDEGQPMRRDAIFRIASMSKPITSTAVMILFEEGRFLLDDPVSRYLPELANLKVVVPGNGDGPLVTEPAKEELTIRHLLTHTSGLIYSAFHPGPLAQAYDRAGIWNGDLAGLVEKLGTLPLAHQPGTAWEYGVSTDVLGRLVEVVSGKPFGTFLEERIFAPLGMRDTAFYVPPAKHDRLAAHYRARDEGGLERAPVAFDASAPPRLPSGGGGLMSTAGDYARFLQMLLNGGELDGVRILGRKSVELMTVDHVRGLPRAGILPDNYGFGLGFAVLGELGRSGIPGSPGTYTWSGIFNTFFWVDPQEELIGVFMTQITPFGYRSLHQRFRVLVYQAIVD